MNFIAAKVAYAIIFLVLISGCASVAPVEYPTTTKLKTIKMYDDTGQLQKYSRIRLVNTGVQVYSIDRKKIGYIVNVDTGELTHEAHVKPGMHDFLLKAMKDFRSYGAHSSWKEASKKVSFITKAGHVYTFTAVQVENRARFSIKDHGTGYDVKCGNIISLEKSALKNYADIKEKRLPAACY